jgi:acetyl esterase/lipase
MRSFLLAIAILSAVPLSLSAEIKQDIVYAKRDGQELQLDIALPAGGEKMRPTIVCIHGGGWKEGKRQSYHGQLQEMSKRGFVVATIDYRLTGVAPWPAQIVDVRDALKWLVHHADDYGIDPQRIGLMGASVGGHLALMLGFQPQESGNDLRVRAIVNFYGPTDFKDIKTWDHARWAIEPLVDGKMEEKLDALKEISPVEYIDRTDPAVLTLHGTKDDIVPFSQATLLHELLNKTQIPNHLFPMEGAGHGPGGDVESLMQAVGKFSSAYLAGDGLPLVFHEDFDHGMERWEPTDKLAWKVAEKDGRTFVSLTKRKSDYTPEVRSPHNINLLKDVEVGDFVLDVDMRSTNDPYGHQDLCLFFGHQDPSHFYYVHLGRKADPHANSIFLVNGEPRVSIAETRTDGTDWSRGWHRARIKRTLKTGKIEVYFDDMQKPVMTATDKTFGTGRIGIGSFDDTGDYDSIRLYSQEAATDAN